MHARSRPTRSWFLLLALGLVLTFALQTVGAAPAQAATRAGIVATANAEVGASQANGRCEKYGPCQSSAWCAYFTTWIWKTAGVSPYPTTPTARATGLWAQSRGLWKARPSGSKGDPQPGDIIQWGTPAQVQGGHVGIVTAVHSNGTITTVEGNVGDAVVRRTINPITDTQGNDNLHVAGYITPPNVGPANLAAESSNGDRYDELFGIDPSGVMWSYPGLAAGGFGSRDRVGPGWGDYSRIGVGDSNGDGYADLWAIGPNGSIHYWHNNAAGGFNSLVEEGNGWGAIDYFSLVDVNGDNKVDILGRDGTTMWYYPGLGRAKFGSRDEVGPGWTTYPRHFGGDADGDGDGDIWATDTGGGLWFWKGTGQGTFASKIDAGGGWTGFNRIGVLDANGDSRADILAVRLSDYTLWQYNGLGNGKFAKAEPAGVGWKGYGIATF
ncbi:FG-GAP-like repeat-containing protein [Tenggerimyces flavus]|uniref:FG-GAP-like repeat-containing protein n=1 Tax=Tenggerimyces flavus TaxID=1708749 RepID=A0ABV7Y7K0_9ACTN|nr:FG-GAP-like repeat-containing protein [Tenggerimyces flavus]MBM7785216.1 hypothetical protein [Tenggerimyces flavus]